MALPKRKLGSLGLDRRVRARREDEWEPEPQSASEDESEDDQVSEEDIRQGDDDDEEEDESGSQGENGSDSESDVSEEEAAPKVDFSSVSFGALARAQASLPPSERSGKKKFRTSQDESQPSSAHPSKAAASRPSRPKRDDESLKRSSKHAPQEQTSKRQVSRRREIIADPRRQARDPRFGPLGLDGGSSSKSVDEARARKAYAFLDEYRDTEMADLRAQIKKTKNAVLKEDLKRQLLSMESKKKATKRKDDEQRVLEEHRRKEKELVAQGKKPFYLKKSEQKKKMLVDRFAGMSKGQVDRAIERKRKKVAGKEKKELDTLQRVRD